MSSSSAANSSTPSAPTPARASPSAPPTTAEIDDLPAAANSAVPNPLAAEGGLFHWREDFDHPIIERYLDFCRFWDIGITGIEFIESADGRLVTYDINTNTNYNPVVEAESGRSGPQAVAGYLATLVTADETELVLAH